MDRRAQPDWRPEGPLDRRRRRVSTMRPHGGHLPGDIHPDLRGAGGHLVLAAETLCRRRAARTRRGTRSAGTASDATRSRRCRSPIDSCLFGREEPYRGASRRLVRSSSRCCSSGFFILEGFDFGVGMLMEPFARDGQRRREPRRRAVLNTIGPVWDGNEVWLLTAGGAMFAAFPGMYATVFSSLYLPLLAILFGMIVRSVSIEWRGKIDDPKWRGWADFGIAAGSWLPAVLWGVAFAILVRGLPVDADAPSQPVDHRRAERVHAAGRPGHLRLFLLYGAIFVVLKTSGAVRDDARGFAVRLSLPVTALVAGFGIWTQLAHGKAWTWLVLAVAVVAQLATVALVFDSQARRLGVPVQRLGGHRRRRVAVRGNVSRSGALDARSAMERDGQQRVLEPLHLEDHDVGRCHFRAAGGGIPRLDLLGFPSAYFG